MKPVDVAFPLSHCNAVEGSCRDLTPPSQPGSGCGRGNAMAGRPGLVNELINSHASGVGAQGFSSLVGRGQGEQSSDISPSSLISSSSACANEPELRTPPGRGGDLPLSGLILGGSAWEWRLGYLPA